MRTVRSRTSERNMEQPKNSHKEGRDGLRMRHRQLRDGMSARDAAEKSSRIVSRLLASGCYSDSPAIFGYYPLGREADCLPLLEQALIDGKTVALPATERTGGSLHDTNDRRMDFYRITSLSQVQAGRFGVMEPLLECPIIEEPHALVIVPGVVFDEQGNRYGYGKGYYDRYFARFPHMCRVAAAYEHQIEQEIAALPTDVRMHGIYTESRRIKIK